MKSSVTRAPRAGIAMDFITPGAGLDVAVTVTLAQIPDRADAAVFLGIAESKLASRETGGKNCGEALRHGYIVHARYGPFSGEARDRVDGKLVIRRLIALGEDQKSSDVALVAFVHNLRTAAIYEALSEPVCTNL